MAGNGVPITSLSPARIRNSLLPTTTVPMDPDMLQKIFPELFTIRNCTFFSNRNNNKNNNNNNNNKMDN